MIKDAEAHADEAHKLRELADAKNQAETLAYATEKSLKEHRDDARRGRGLDDRGPDHGAEAGARGRRRRARSAPRRDALQEASHKLAEAVYAQATGRSRPRRSGAATAPADSDDEVIEEATTRSSTRRRKTS